MRTMLLLFSALHVLNAPLHAEEKPDPRESLDTAIPEAIRLLEKKDYEGLLKAFVAPKELEMLTAKMSLPEFARAFGEGNSELLLKALKSVQGSKPEYNADQSVATFQMKEQIPGKRDIQFQKVDKYWYIKN